MTIDIHKVITGNPITKNLMKPWGSNKEITYLIPYTWAWKRFKKQIDL